MWMQEEVAGVATTNCNSDKQVKLTVRQAHEKLGHINEQAIKDISKDLGWVLTNTGKLNCVAFAAGKAKHKSPKKVLIVDPDDGKEGYRGYLDLSTIKKNNNYPHPNNPKMVIG